MGTLRLIAVLAVAMLAALAVWTWLPPTGETKTAAANAVAGFETARQMAWPSGDYGRTYLTAGERRQLIDSTLTALDQYAAASVLTTLDTNGSVDALVASRKADARQIVLGWRGKVVYFKVLRRALNGKLLVRAGVRLSHEVGTWDAKSRRVVDRRWVAQTGVPVRQYTLGDYGTGWKVEAVQDWGRCAPDGSNVQEGPPQG